MNTEELEKLSQIPEGLKSDWLGTNHYEITDPNGLEYFWLIVPEIFLDRNRCVSDFDDGQRLGLILDSFVKIPDLVKQLQAETQRADKAEEMVLAYSEIMHQFFLQKPPLGTNFYAFMSNLEAKSKELCSESEAVAKAFRQKLCDEIVGKIEADVKYTIDCAQTGSDEFKLISEGKVFAFNIAIDIVKSVLIEEE